MAGAEGAAGRPRAGSRGTETPLTLAGKAAEFFGERGIENARYEAELLLAHVLGVRRLELYLQHDRPLTASEVEAFRNAVRRRLAREPVQYIVGETQFRDLTLTVDERVLIPRPETEILVGEVLRWAAARPGDGLSAVDVGTGSGAIALSLVHEGPFERVIATDVSANALEVAAENARRCGLADRVDFREGPLLDVLTEGERVDAVVSNPPYVSEAERAELPPDVRDWEPGIALFAREGGRHLLEALVECAPAHLRAGGLLALEVGLGQAGAVAARIEASGEYGPPRVVRDYADRERVVLAEIERTG